MASAKPKNVCDVPGCGHSRKASHRLCTRCFDKLPGDIRLGIMEAHHQRRLSDWTKLKREAAAFLNLGEVRDRVRGPGKSNFITAARAYEMNARLLGERPDA